MKKRLLFVGGLFSLFLAFIGAVTPLMPTTPFLLLAAWFFSRSSQRMHHWIMTNRFFGKYLSDYKEKRGIPLWIKIATITFMWIWVITSFFLFRDYIIVLIVIPVISILATIHILRFKTL